MQQTDASFGNCQDCVGFIDLCGFDLRSAFHSDAGCGVPLARSGHALLCAKSDGTDARSNRASLGRSRAANFTAMYDSSFIDVPYTLAEMEGLCLCKAILQSGNINPLGRK